MEEITLNGFEIFEDIMPGGNVGNKTTVQQPMEEDIDIVSEELTDEELDKIRNNNGKDEDTTDTEEKSDEEDIQPKKVKKDKNEQTQVKDDVVDDEQEQDIDENTDETNSVTSFFEALSDRMGWEIEEDEEVPSTPEELVEYFKNVIEENSVPQYSSDEVEALDNFVRNGGNIRDYFQIDGDIDLENIDITEDETNQKLIVKEFLKEKGFSVKQIDKKISKYEDAGLLEDEAEDALEALKEIKQQKKQQLLEDQEKQAVYAKKRQQEYFNSVVNEIKGMDNIRGIKIPEKDKKVLLEYIFKPDANGQTKFQKDWSKSVKNLLESAYFTMKGDILLKAAKSEGSNSAINKFKNSLNRTGISKKTKKQDNTSAESMWNSFAQSLRAN